MDTVSARARSSNAASCSCSQSQTFRRNVSAWDVQSSRRHFRGFVSAPGQPKFQAHLSAPATREDVPVVTVADRDEPFTALAMGLLLGAGSFLVYALGADFANAANLETSREPAFHPVAADIQNLADNVSQIFKNSSSNRSVPLKAKTTCAEFVMKVLFVGAAGGLLGQFRQIWKILPDSASRNCIHGNKTAWRIAEETGHCCTHHRSFCQLVSLH